ncbi:VH1-interacting kinase isoform X2 [Wolffia australiana]
MKNGEDSGIGSLPILQAKGNKPVSCATSPSSSGTSPCVSPSSGVGSTDRVREKARVSRTSLILWHTHQNDVSAVRKLLEEDPSLVKARDYDNRTPLHVAALHGWMEVALCLLDNNADVNAQDRWHNTFILKNGMRSFYQPLSDFFLCSFLTLTFHGPCLGAPRKDETHQWRNGPEIMLCMPLADAEGAKKKNMIDLLKKHGGSSFGQSGSHFEPKQVPPPLPNKCDWEVDPSELDFSSSTLIGKGSFGEILKACWRGTPVAVKRILPSLSDDRLVTQDFRHEVNLLVKLRHPNIVQFLGAVTQRKPLMLITEYLRGGDLHQYLKEKGSLHPLTAISFALDMARGMAYLHNEPNVIIHRDLKPRNVLLVNSSADHLKVGDFGLSKLIKVQNSHDVYKMTGETGSYRYMAPEVFRHRKYDKKVDVFSFAMILYEMLEGEPPFSNFEPYEAAKRVAEGHRPMFRAKGIHPDLKNRR